MRKLCIVLAVIFICATFVGCARSEEDKNTLVIYSSHPIAFIESLLSDFENETGIRVKTVSAGTGEIIKKIQSEKDVPQADILWGGSYSTVLPFTKYFEDYRSENEKYMLDQFKNTEGCMTRFSDIPSVLMVNRNLVGDLEINGYQDLLNDKLKGKIAMSNPAKSSSSREHIINIVYGIGGGDFENAKDYLEKLCVNLDGKLLDSSTDVYEGVSSGRFAVGLTFEEGARKFAVTDNNIEVIYMSEGVVSTPDGVYMVKNAKNKDNAKKFIDYITSYEIQQYMVDNLNRRSVRCDVMTPKSMKSKSEINLIDVDYEYVEENCASWLEQFGKIFER